MATREAKSPGQLRCEIAYYRRQMASTKSLDRQKRAQSAIRVRELELRAAEALRRVDHGEWDVD